MILNLVIQIYQNKFKHLSCIVICIKIVLTKSYSFIKSYKYKKTLKCFYILIK